MGALLVLLFIAVPIGFLVLFAVFAGGISKASEKAKANAPAMLDEAFDGREVVTWKVTLDSLSEQDVIEGAADRGYRLTGSTQQGRVGPTTLAFERR